MSTGRRNTKKTRYKRKYSKRKRIYKIIKKNRKQLWIVAIVLIGIIIFFGILLSSGGYRYRWDNSGKADVTEEFLDKVVEISDKLDIDPDDLMTVMAFESRLDHKTVNPLSGATGLIQWMPETAAELGTSTEELKNMTAVEQLDYVYKYLKPYKGKLRTISDLYMSVLWPAAVGKEEDYVLFKSGTTAYRQNDGLDINEDGLITKEEATQKVIQNRKYYIDDIEKQETDTKE